jgi:hypothetical protein
MLEEYRQHHGVVAVGAALSGGAAAVCAPASGTGAHTAARAAIAISNPLHRPMAIFVCCESAAAGLAGDDDRKLASGQPGS